MTEADFRCSLASLAATEPLAGSAPTERSWLFIEAAMPWGRQALAESRLPDAVRERLMGLVGVRVQLIRRHGAESSSGVAIIAATATTDGFAVERARLADHHAVLDLRLDDLAAGLGLGLPASTEPLWLVCTNGRRDRCCAELGRPAAAALAARWPEGTWETTHLGGHRFAPTLLALPSGAVLGRIDPDSAVDACAALADGRMPLGLLRGRAGLASAAQVAEIAVREHLGLLSVGGVEVDTLGDGELVVSARSAGARRTFRAEVAEQPGPPARLSCADDVAKPTSRFTVTAIEEQPVIG